MNLCKDCKFWLTESAYSNLQMKMGLGLCENTVEFWSATERCFGDDVDERVFTEKAKGKKAFTQDGSDYMSSLYTTPDFGCVQFEAKPG